MIEDILKQYIRHGKITSINQNNTARVQFADLDNLVSYDLKILVPNAGKNKYQAIPDVGSSAVCLMLPTGHCDGFILGCYYDDENSAPIGDLAQKMHWTFEDGTILNYDVKKHHLSADVKGTILAKAEKQATIEAPAINLKGNVIIHGSLEVIINETTVAAVSGGKLNVSGQLISRDGIEIKQGDLTVGGNIKATGTVKGSNL